MSDSVFSVPLPKQKFTDQAGRPLGGGFVYTYVPGTTTNKATYTDLTGTTQNPNPVPLDAAGSAAIFGSGNYRLIVKDQNGVLVTDGEASAGDSGISAAMAPVVAAETIQAAVQLLGLALGQIVPCTAVISGTNIALTRQSGTNPQSFQLGTYLCFISPDATSGPFTLSEVSDSLGALPLYDSPGINQTTSLAQNQPCIVMYDPAIGSGAWVLVNPAISGQFSSARFQLFTENGTFVCPSWVTDVYLSYCGGAGAGGAGGPSNTGSYSGGGGGGAGEAYDKQLVTLTSSGTYSITVGTGGTGSLGSAGGAGTATYIEDSSFATLASAAGGMGGALGSDTGGAAGGDSGGAGGNSGGVGRFFGTTNPGVGGAGGGGLFGAGGAGGAGDDPGEPGAGYGAGGGAGGSGAAAINNAGGNGSPGKMLLEW